MGNKKAKALCAIVLGGAAAAAQAQSSYLLARVAQLPENAGGAPTGAQLYGGVDLGAMYSRTDHASARWQMQSGGVQASRFGFYAREDLAGGLRAEIKLESGLQADTGTQQAAALFNRESWIGLRSAEWGAVRLGNQINAMLPLFIDPYGLVNTNSVYTWIAGGAVQTAKGVIPNADLGNGAAALSARVPKAVTYHSPRIGGAQAQMIYATSSTGATNPSVGTRGGVVSYIVGHVYVAASLIQVWGSPIAVTPGAALEGQRTDIPMAGIIYDTGALVLSSSYAKIKPRVPNAAQASLVTAGAILPQGAFTYRASAIYRDTEGVRDGAGKPVASSALGVMLGAEYAMSKRSGLYARYGLLRNFGASTLILNSVALPLVNGTATPQTGIETRTASLGMYHNF